jgi:dethiobiotin synthase
MQGKASMIAGYEDHVPYRYEPACSPHLAAKLSGDFIKMEYLHDRFEYIANRETHVTLVEGAGGLYVPLNDHDFMIDLIYQLKLPTILVTSSRLGTLNQTLLSIRTLQNARIPLAGVIFNNYPEAKEAYIYRDNLAMIREYSRPVPFLEVHYGDVPNATVREFCNRIGQI